MSAQLKVTLARLDRIERSPAVSLSRAAMTTEIVRAGTNARATDARMLNEACDALSRSIGRIDGIVERGRSADGLKKWLQRYCTATALAVLLVGTVSSA